MNDTPFRIVSDPTWGYRRLDPLPADAELTAWYESKYYDLVRKGGRACELGRLMAGGETAARERAWLCDTLYTDVRELLIEHAPGRRVLDVGCGTGDLLESLAKHGFDCVGTEPSTEAAGVARARGLDVRPSTFTAFLAAHRASGAAPYDAVTLMNVLEHVPHPAEVLDQMAEVVRPGGIVCVRVPNEFTDLQAAASPKVGRAEYWVAAPDHINYFDFASLGALLGEKGFSVVYQQGDFPMELFLLMGEHYVGNPEVGAACHQKRIAMETAMPGALRRRIYAALGAAGVGRNAMVLARRA